MSDIALSRNDAKFLGLPTGAKVKRRELSKSKVFNSENKKWTVTETFEIELTRFDCWVEVSVAKLAEMMPAALRGKEGKPVSWKDGRIYYTSRDGTKAIICLSPKVGESAYDAAKLTDEMMQEYVKEFGPENLLDFEEFATLKNSSEYTEASQGGV